MRRDALLVVGWLLIGCSGTGGGDGPSGSERGGSSGAASGSGTGGGAGSTSLGGGAASGGGSAGEPAGGGGTTGGGGSGGSGGNGGGDSSGGSGGTLSSSCTPSSGTETIAGGALLDKATCLIWEEAPGFVAAGNWEPARDYCADLMLAGFDDWRMPSTIELASTPVAFTDRLATSPRYLPDGTSDLNNFHYCGVVHWSPEQPRGCGWVGPANMDGTICVRGEAASALTPPAGCTCQEGEAGYTPAVE